MVKLSNQSVAASQLKLNIQLIELTCHPCGATSSSSRSVSLMNPQYIKLVQANKAPHFRRIRQLFKSLPHPKDAVCRGCGIARSRGNTATLGDIANCLVCIRSTNLHQPEINALARPVASATAHGQKAEAAPGPAPIAAEINFSIFFLNIYLKEFSTSFIDYNYRFHKLKKIFYRL